MTRYRPKNIFPLRYRGIISDITTVSKLASDFISSSPHFLYSWTKMSRNENLEGNNSYLRKSEKLPNQLHLT